MYQVFTLVYLTNYKLFKKLFMLFINETILEGHNEIVLLKNIFYLVIFSYNSIKIFQSENIQIQNRQYLNVVFENKKFNWKTILISTSKFHNQQGEQRYTCCLFVTDQYININSLWNYFNILFIDDYNYIRMEST